MVRVTNQTGTAQRILDIAEGLVQTRGFNAFSYADIAAALHMTKASLHYHFASKADLGVRLIERYATSFMAALDAITRECPEPRERLRRYAALYEGVLRENRMCLCGMLAAEFATLDRRMRTALTDFFDRNEGWLIGVLEAGRNSGSLRFNGDAQDAARLLVGSLEGAMMLARSYADPARFHASAQRLLGDLGVMLDGQAR